MLDRDDLNRLFIAKHRIYTPDETIDGAPDERLAIMEGVRAPCLHRAAYTLMVKCPRER